MTVPVSSILDLQNLNRTSFFIAGLPKSHWGINGQNWKSNTMVTGAFSRYGQWIFKIIDPFAQYLIDYHVDRTYSIKFATNRWLGLGINTSCSPSLTASYPILAEDKPKLWCCLKTFSCHVRNFCFHTKFVSGHRYAEESSWNFHHKNGVKWQISDLNSICPFWMPEKWPCFNLHVHYQLRWLGADCGADVLVAIRGHLVSTNSDEILFLVNLHCLSN